MFKKICILARKKIPKDGIIASLGLILLNMLRVVRDKMDERRARAFQI